MPTLQKHITTKHSNIINMVVMYMFFCLHWERDAATVLFLKRTENILQHTADDVNFLSKQNMQMKCANTIK